MHFGQASRWESASLQPGVAHVSLVIVATADIVVFCLLAGVVVYVVWLDLIMFMCLFFLGM